MGSLPPQILYAMRVKSKLIVRLSRTDMGVESLAFLLWIQKGYLLADTPIMWAYDTS